MKNIVHALRLAGVDVEILHYRNCNLGAKRNSEMFLLPYSGNTVPVTAKGGKTVVDVRVNGRLYTGEAVCSISENYCRAKGVEIALERASKAALTT